MACGEETETGRFYRYMVEHVKRVLADPKRVCPAYDAAQGYEIAGFVWLQGFNDMVDGHTYPDRGKPGRFAVYSDLLSKFIRDVRKDSVRRRCRSSSASWELKV
jgi:hypothetical protein